MSVNLENDFTKMIDGVKIVKSTFFVIRIVYSRYSI